ncbi:hypothetical protein U3516DRAFT_851229 [Neocallimastix sp. 'constans']
MPFPPMLHYGTNGVDGDEDGDGYQWHEERHHQDNHEKEKKEDSSKDSNMVMATGLDYSRSSDRKVDQKIEGTKERRRESNENSVQVIRNNNDSSNYKINN